MRQTGAVHADGAPGEVAAVAADHVRYLHEDLAMTIRGCNRACGRFIARVLGRDCELPLEPPRERMEPEDARSR